MLSLEALAFPNEFIYYEKLVELLDPNDELYDYFTKKSGHTRNNNTDENHETLVDIINKIQSFKEIESLSLLKDIKDSFDRLNVSDFDKLKANFALKQEVQEVSTSVSVSIENWLDWFSNLRKVDFDDYLTLAKFGADEWTHPSDAERKIYAEQLYNIINEALSESRIAACLTDSMPYIVKWLSEDPEFPSLHFKDIYAGLITVLTLSDEIKNKNSHGSVQNLTTAMLSFNLKSSSYEHLLQDLNELIGDGIGLNQVYWILDLIEELYAHPTPSSDIRSNFLHKVSTKIHGVYQRLTRANC